MEQVEDLDSKLRQRMKIFSPIVNSQYFSVMFGIFPNFFIRLEKLLVLCSKIVVYLK